MAYARTQFRSGKASELVVVQGLTSECLILIGEGDESVADRLRFLLEEGGASVIVESTGSRALDQLLNESFTLVFLAVSLPILNGVDTLTFLRKQQITTPAIALVDADDLKAKIVQDAGFECLLDRNLLIEDVQAAVELALGCERDDGGTDQDRHRIRAPFFSKSGNVPRRK